MKQVLLSLKVNENSCIEFYFPDIENKFNYFYEPTEKLHRFDEITIDYRNGGSINLYHDVLDDGSNALYLTLQRAQQKTCELPDWIEMGDLVRCLNESHEDGAEQKYKDIDFSNFWLWSTAGGAQSFVYTRNGKLYLEIGYIYKWHSRERKDSDTDFISYEEFAKNYKPILIQEITDEMTRDWSAQCGALISQIDTSRPKIPGHVWFEDFEQAVMHKIMEKETPINAVLKEQYKNADIEDRLFSRVGFFTTFTLSQDAPRITELDKSAYGDVEAVINDLDGYGFILFIEKGALICLEGYTWRDEWPREIRSFSLVHRESQNPLRNNQ